MSEAFDKNVLHVFARKGCRLCGSQGWFRVVGKAPQVCPCADKRMRRDPIVRRLMGLEP